MTRRNPRALVIGYGSTLRGDDAFGSHVARQLRPLVDPSHVQVLVRHCLAPEIADDLAQVELAIFVDAALHGETGSMTCQRVDCGGDRLTTIAHASEPADLLALAKELYDDAPRSYLISVRGECFDLQPDCLSGPVQSAVTPATRKILSILERELNDDPRRVDPVNV